MVRRWCFKFFDDFIRFLKLSGKVGLHLTEVSPRRPRTCCTTALKSPFGYNHLPVTDIKRLLMEKPSSSLLNFKSMYVNEIAQLSAVPNTDLHFFPPEVCLFT